MGDLVNQVFNFNFTHTKGKYIIRPTIFSIETSISILIEIRLVISDATHVKRPHELPSKRFSFYVPGAKNAQKDRVFLVRVRRLWFSLNDCCECG
jgi:hypothetical protein